MYKYKKKSKRKWFLIFLAFVAFVYVNNSSLLASPKNDSPVLLAHRGLAQTFSLEGVENDTCTAQRIYEPEHPFLENTIPSMEAAFQVLWGFPNRFQNRMDQADTRVIIVGGDGSDFSSGFDSLEDVQRLPASYTGGIWTNRIDRIAPIYKQE